MPPTFFLEKLRLDYIFFTTVKKKNASDKNSLETLC